MKISVCVPSTRADTVGDAIESIRGQTHPDWELIVVCQQQHQLLRAVVLDIGRVEPRLRLVTVDSPGLSRARNAALSAAQGAVVAMTDDDCEAEADWLAVIVDVFTCEPEVGLVGGSLKEVRPEAARLANCPNLEPVEALYDPVVSPRKPPPGFDWVGANFAVRRDVAAQVGPFDELLGAGADFASAEDVDYKFRLESLGVPMRSTGRAVVRHTHGCRVGLRSLIRYQHGQARGTGALAGKLTMLDDPRGREWLEQTRRRCMGGWSRPHRLPVDMAHLAHFIRGYRDCLREFAVDGSGLLTPRKATASPASVHFSA